MPMPESVPAQGAQAESYATQMEYYTEKIENNPLWEFAGVYADEGITGTKVKGRDDFKAMIAACEDGDIDLILTKSITRFARNAEESHGREMVKRRLCGGAATD